MEPTVFKEDFKLQFFVFLNKMKPKDKNLLLGNKRTEPKEHYLLLIDICRLILECSDLNFRNIIVSILLSKFQKNFPISVRFQDIKYVLSKFVLLNTLDPNATDSSL